MKEMGGKGLLRDVGVGSGGEVTLDRLHTKINGLTNIYPGKHQQAHDIAHKLWADTEGGKHLKGEPVKDLLGLLMHRLQQEHVIKKRK